MVFVKSPTSCASCPASCASRIKTDVPLVESYCAFQKHANSEVQKPTHVYAFPAINHLNGPLTKQKFTLTVQKVMVCDLFAAKNAIVKAAFELQSLRV